MPSTCLKCHSDFTPRRYEQKYCSDKCRWNSISLETRRAKRQRWLDRGGRQHVKEYNKNNKDYLLQLNYQWKEKNKDSAKNIARKALLKRYYGITLDQYDQLLKKQDDKCAVCNRHKSVFNKNLAVDHDHKTQEIRGALCTHCNRTIIGRNRDPEIFKRAYEYLSGPFTGWFAPKVSRKRKRKAK